MAKNPTPRRRIGLFWPAITLAALCVSGAITIGPDRFGMVFSKTKSDQSSRASDREQVVSGQKNTRWAFTNFDSVSVSGPDNVIIQHGAKFDFVMEGESDDIADLSGVVENGELQITRKTQGWRSAGADPVNITITMPRVKAASLRGSGDLSIDKMEAPTARMSLNGSGDLRVRAVRSPQLQLDLRGSGDLVANGVMVDQVNAILAGSGDLKIEGVAKAADLTLNGSGDLSAATLNVQNLVTSLAGSGDLAAHASGVAQVNAHGSGTVTISGTSQCRIDKSENAEVDCAN